MAINLNDASFDAKTSGSTPFNGGVAGIVNNVTAKISKKTPEDKPNSPDYKVTFTDEKGGSCNTSFWYVTEATSYKTVEELIASQAKVLKHLVHAIMGDSYQFPPYETAKAMLDGCMATIHKAVAGQKFRIFANYGTKTAQKKYIQPRSWVPFIEPASVSIESTRLVASDLDLLERPSETTFGAPKGASTTATSAIDDWE